MYDIEQMMMLFRTQVTPDHSATGRSQLSGNEVFYQGGTVMAYRVEI
ncbi:MAG: hypothetical protein IH598_08280 [Bacteroidales bacterium]|nr:hypothetical protein [Bacteroidales bacterium]